MPFPVKSRQIMYNLKSKFKLDELMAPIPEGTTFNGIFTRRDKTKLGSSIYYLYSQDSENLLLAATPIGSSKHYVISTSSTEIKEGSEFHVASSEVSGLAYTFYDHAHKPVIKVIHKSLSEKKGLLLQIEIQLFNENHEPIEDETKKVVQRLPKKENGVNVLRMPSIPIPGMTMKPSEKNLILEYKNEISLAFQKMEDDEFYLAIRSPLSILQGYCVALAMMHRFVTE